MGKKNMSKQEKTIPVGIGIGVGISVISSLVIAAILAAMIASGRISPSSQSYGTLILLMASSIIGSAVSAMQIKSKRMIICLATALCYFLVLLCITALFFDGMYQGVPVTGLVVMGGGIIAGMLPTGQARSNKSRKRKKHYG